MPLLHRSRALAFESQGGLCYYCQHRMWCADPDQFAHALGVELVAETENGFMLVATEDLSFQRLAEVLAVFEAEKEGGGVAASLLEVFEPRDDPHRDAARV